MSKDYEGSELRTLEHVGTLAYLPPEFFATAAGQHHDARSPEVATASAPLRDDGMDDDDAHQVHEAMHDSSSSRDTAAGHQPEERLLAAEPIDVW